MKSTVIGPYPRVGSEYGDRLRKELNKKPVDSDLVEQLRRDLTTEVVREMISAGIDLPNTGLIEVHDELTWPAEAFDGVAFAGMKKIFHTNTHYRPVVVNGEIRRKTPIVNVLYDIASETHPQVKVELPGPYTIAQHSVLGEGSPYATIGDLARAYARVYREELLGLQNVPFIQFNEPSAVAFGREHPNVTMLPELYAMMLEGVKISTSVWTFYGTYSPEILDLLFSLPVNTIGLDFVWDKNVDELLKKRTTDKGIGIGVVDSGDQGFIRPDSLDALVARVRGLKDYIDFNRALVSSNATLEHLPRDLARNKLALIGDLSRRMS